MYFMKMPVKRALCLERPENQTPAKRHAPNRNYSPMTGTCRLSPTVVSPAGKAKATQYSLKPQLPQTEVEKLHAIRSKLEGSVAAFIKARQELEQIMAAEGSSELNRFFSRGSAELKTELKRHEELTAQAESCRSVDSSGQSPMQGVVQIGSSAEFLKSIMGL
ncbi:centromere protein R isoform X1 [Esox lucius]|uniref:centromere protein R isoform X1 n=1 Tax=Esox lucius TaxID=8010 RepID=UPI0014777AAB|nr:centromere protein R isoform X1 [Esox lucius]XP_010870679.2 centromere protein R isoform X1 [Esox lucius]XP_019904911.2 centromere protein R isoform X1 [Esox lucius]